MKHLQKLGRAMMNPVAVLPVAAILMGLGYWIDPLYWGEGNQFAAFLIKSGGSILDNLGILFAVGVAYGLAKDRDGASAFSGLVAFLIITTLLSPGAVAQLRGVPAEAVLPTEGFGKINNAFIGILSGIVAALCYNKYSGVQLPDFLAFFSGRRLAPIMTAFFMLITSGVMFFLWPIIYGGLVGFGESIQSMGALGAGIYAFFNRLLIPTGLHHALNSVFWFDTIGINDIPNFLNGVVSPVPGVTTGMYQAGFFPIMMFGLPGAALAMYHTAKTEKKKLAFSLLLAASFASFFTGVTEPLEFGFMFLAPGLYVLHALLTGISVFIAASLKWMAGFGFSAGLVDLFLSIPNPLATNWYMLIPMGLVFFAIYYIVFRFAITRWDLKTPGREDDDAAREGEGQELAATTDFASMASIILAGLGGRENVESLDHCITRLRVEVRDRLEVDEKQIKSANISGIIRPSKNGVQVIIGPQVQFLYDEMKKLI